MQDSGTFDGVGTWLPFELSDQGDGTFGGVLPLGVPLAHEIGQQPAPEGAQHRVAILDHGRLVAIGTPQELRAAVGEEVITLVPRVATDLETFRARLREDLGVEAQSVGGGLRIEGVEGKDGPALVGRIMSDLGDDLASVTAGRPTLEDVFLHQTGNAFE